MKRAWLGLAAIAAVSAVLQLGGEGWLRALRYERNAILDGQLWRAVTGHFVHLGWMHLALNLAGGVVLVALVGRRLSWKPLAICVVGVSAGLFLAMLRLHWYVGFSGVLYGLFVFGSIEAYRADRHKVWLVVLAVIALKIAFEIIFGATAGDLIGGPVIVEAHLFGAISGAVAVGLLYRRRSRR